MVRYRPQKDFLGADHKAEDYEQVSDILDVWFDSGVTHAFVMEARDDLAWPADVYLEGSDQHRGWFHSSLLEACATRGAAPIKTSSPWHDHDRARQKNVKIARECGRPVKSHSAIGRRDYPPMDHVVRLFEDQRIGPEIIKANTDAYRKIRNSFRFCWAIWPILRIAKKSLMPICPNWNAICCTVWRIGRAGAR